MHASFLRFSFVGIFCFIVFGLSAQNDILDTKLDVNFSKKPIDEVLVSISRTTSINISFNPSLLIDTKKVTMNAKDVKLGDFLDVIFDGSNIAYTVSGKQIILTSFDPNVRIFESPMKELSGYIEDSNSGERLPFAYLYTEDGEIAISTNEYGYYNFEVPAETENIFISYLGYKDTMLSVQDLIAGKLDINLTANTKLNEVVIKEKRENELVDDYDIQSNNSLKQMKKMQTFGGQMDVVRFIHTQPGVSTGADGLGGFSVRGGNADNNLILLDGIPVYNTSHSLGVFSIFDESSIKSSKFYKSHIPAQYGGRLSSVLDIRTVEGNLEEFSGEVNVGLITAGAFIEGPILKNKISYAVSGRRTIFDPYLKPISEFLKESQDRNGQTDYVFGDFNAKIQFVINKKNRIYLSYYTGSDMFDDEGFGEEISNNIISKNEAYFNSKWGNTLYSLRWSSLLSDKVFSNVSIFSSSYNFDAAYYTSSSIDSTNSNIFFDSDASIFNTSIRDIGIKWDVDYYIDSRNKARMGINAVSHDFKPGLVAENSQDFTISRESQFDKLTNQLNIPSRTAQEFELYYDHQYKYRRSIINAGLRASIISSSGKSYYALQPRIALKSAFTNKLYGKLSGNITTQYLHLLATSGLGLPTDIWIPSTNKIRPQTAYQVSTGIDLLLTKKLVFSSEIYYKSLRNILNLKEGAVFSVIEDTNWEDDIPVGNGEAYGWENSIAGSWNRHFLSFNYTYAFSTRNFDQINGGKRFYSRFDRRHQINSTYQVQINNNISFNAVFTLATGHPQTLPTLIFDGNIIYTEKNNQRLPTYDRLDLGFQIDNEFDWGSQTITLGVYNAYNKKNPYFYFLSFEPDNVLNFSAKQVTVFPLLPNVSYRLRF